MPTYAELQQQIAQLQQQAQAARSAEIAAVIGDINAKMLEYGITLADIGPGPRSFRAKVVKVAPKYANPATGETWSGRGMVPRWLRAEVSLGKDKESFRV